MRFDRILFAMIAASFLGACAEQPRGQVIATTEQLMYGMVEPLSTVVFESVQTIVDREGVHEIQPETEEEWEFVRNSALSLAESTNLLLYTDREFSESTPELRDDWVEHTNGLRDAALEAAEAARARNPEGLFAAGSSIYENGCLACHEAYVPEE
jgi:hypothetical protein